MNLARPTSGLRMAHAGPELLGSIVVEPGNYQI